MTCMVHTEVYIQCITLIYYTHAMVHTEVYIQCITLIYYTHDMVHTARTARFSKKSLRSDVGEIKKMSEK